MSAQVAIIMGSDSDWPVMKAASDVLKDFGVACHVEVVSAHRTPDHMARFSKKAKAAGYKIIIAGAGGAAHLPGMVASYTPLPVIGVPITVGNLKGLDALLSVAQMPRGVPVATVAVDNSTNAALLAVRILATNKPALLAKIEAFNKKQKTKVQRANKKLKALI